MFVFWIIVCVLLGVWIAYAKSPTARGKRGENKVRRAIGDTIENERYVINNLMLNNEGKTSQIDHIVINPRGIFVIETKNYSGNIYGDENQREWTQVLAYGKVKNKLYNPIKQNATHMYNVRKIVGRLPVYSLVVFVQNNTQNITARNVIPLSRLRAVLKYGEDKLTISQMETAYYALLKNKAEISTKEHVDNIKQQQNNLQYGICPRCNGRLVLRNGRYGQFWGCSNYPSCRFIKKG